MKYMNEDQEKLWNYLEWLRVFVVKYKEFDNQKILEEKLSKSDVFNVGMLKMFFEIITLYAKNNHIDVEVKNNIKEYHVFFRKTYFNISNIVGTDTIYIKKCEKENYYYIDLSSLVGNRYSRTNNDLNNIHLAISNLLNKGLEIDEIRKILNDYLDAFIKLDGKKER